MIVEPVLSPWLIIAVLTIATVLLAWHEFKKNYPFQMLRLVAVILMMIAIAGLLLKPGYSSKKSRAIVLLTPGYPVDKVDSILARHPDLVLMHLAETTSYKNSQLLPLEDLAAREQEIKIVIGEGLPRYELDDMEGTFDFIPLSLPQGITELSMSGQAVPDRKNTVKGTVNNQTGKGWIYLSGPGGTEDSVSLSNKGLNNFELSFVPKQYGEVLYAITVKDSVVAYTEDLPVHVDSARHLRILFLHSYPTFETRYLKTFLGQKKHKLVLRYQLTKNNFRNEYINQDPISIGRITPELLNSLDLVIMDGAAIDALTPSEKKDLEKSIFSGLGFVHLIPAVGKSEEKFFPFETRLVKSDTAAVKIGSKSFSLPALRFRILPNANTSAIHENKGGILSGYTFRGAGKVGFQLIQETYRLFLSGDSISYAEFWTPLLEQVSRPVINPSKIRIATPFPWYQDEPIDIEIISSAGDGIVLYDDSTSLPLKEDVTFDNIWHARTWPGTPGWHRLETSDGTFLPYYVSSPAGWRTLRVINQQNENKLSSHSELREASTQVQAWKKFPALIFYTMFVLSAGFIWLAPKL